MWLSDNTTKVLPRIAVASERRNKVRVKEGIGKRIRNSLEESQKRERLNRELLWVPLGHIDYVG